MNRFLTVAALALVAFARIARAEDGGEKRPDDGKAEEKERKPDEKKAREERAAAEKRAAEMKRWTDEKKKCERDGHHRCADEGRRKCENRDCERGGHKKCVEEVRGKCKRACEEIRAKAKKEKGGDVKAGEKGGLDMKPGDILPAGKKERGDEDGKCEPPTDGKKEEGKECEPKEEGGEAKEKGAEEGDGVGDLK